MFMNKLYPKGSEWRKWDLHVHTPESVLNSGFGSDWDIYVQELFKRAIANNISAIGITDYFTIDGYKKIKTDYLGNPQKMRLLFNEDEILKIKEILVLPNIEFRLDKLVDDNRVNFHVLFSNEVLIQDIEENFLRELKFAFEGNPQAPDEKRTLTKHNLEVLGARLQKEHEEFRDNHSTTLYTGMMNAVVSDEQITTVLNASPSIFKGNYLVVTPSDEDLSDINWDSQGHNTRKVLLQKSDCLFASNPKTRKWGLGKLNESVENYIQEFKTLKACIWGSDAHNFEELFTKNSQRLCWIKADPTFIGLKQVLYEPEERVYIGERRPDEKKLYAVIDKIKFIDPNFMTHYIPINENFTAIIGGKSTGKSILLKSIAKTVDSEEFSKRHNSARLIERRTVKGFEVFWKDGQISKLNGIDNPTKKIIYIPQSYLNRVVDEEEKTSDIDEIIKEVLLQKDEFKTWFESLESRKKAISDKIENLIKGLFDKIDYNLKKRKEKKEAGDENGINQQLNKLSREIKDIQGKSTVSDDDLAKYNDVMSQVKTKQASLEFLQEDIKNIEKLKKIEIALSGEDLNALLGSLFTEITNLFLEKSKFYQEDWSSVLQNKINELRDKETVLDSEIKALKSTVSNIVIALVELESLSVLMKEREKEEKTLKLIKEIDSEIKKSQEEIDKYIKGLGALNSDYYELFIEAKSKVNLNVIDDDLGFSIDTTFRKNKFQNQFVEKCLDGRTTRGGAYSYLTSYNFSNSEGHSLFLSTEAKKVIENSLPVREGMSKREVITSLFKNWFTHDYKVTFQGDDLSDMSPGKKSFVLLRLLIDLDDSENPILIDQPEDDLDNRSIYNEVVKFLRRRKSGRQIIIVTHNPNLVLGADSEQIIIANQNGDDTKNITHQFEYVSGSIEDTRKEDTGILEVLYKRGTQEHICDILEGGREAFDKRKKKYNF